MEAFLIDAFLKDMSPGICMIVLQKYLKFLLCLIVQSDAHFGGSYIFLH